MKEMLKEKNNIEAKEMFEMIEDVLRYLKENGDD